MEKKLQKPKLKMVKLRADELRIHPVAQREIVPSNLKRIVAHLDLDAIGVLQAVDYDTRGVLIIDGQHRLRALLEHDFGEWMVDVQVHLYIQNDKGACDLFLKLNRGATVSPYETFMKEFHAEYPEAIGAARLVQKHHLKIGKTNADATVTCVATLKRLFKIDHGKTLDAVLGAILTAWGSKSAALEGKLIEGIGLVFSKYKDGLDKPALIKKLGKFPGGPTGLIGSARGLMQHQKLPLSRCVGDLVINSYNRGKSIGKLDPL
jgi:hypothetical protein